MTHDDASVETGVGGQATYDMMMVFCVNALQKHHKTLKSSTRRYPDSHMMHILHRYNKYDKYYCIPLSKIRSTQDRNGFEVLVQV